MAHKLIKATDAHMTRPRIALPREPHFYPSEASAVWVDKNGLTRVAGACLRSCWYRYTGKVEAAPTSPYTQWIFALGKHVEMILVEEWKQMGIWIDNNLKFFDKEKNVSGELDVILIEPDTGQLYGVEVKSFYGYMATRDICGNKSVKGRPKVSQLMQTLIYADQCKDFLPYFKMVYYARDAADRREFDITITDGNKPTIDGEVDTRFTMDDIYDRFATLLDYVDQEEPPPRDFEIVWGPDKVESFKAAGEVSKSAYEKWKKNPALNPIGDWQCRYCSYANTCWNKVNG